MQRHALLELECDGVDVQLNYPRDVESVFFFTEPDWLSEKMNHLTLGGKAKTLQQVLSAMCTAIGKHNEQSHSGQSGSEDDDDGEGGSDLSQSGGLGVSGYYGDDGARHFALSPMQYADLCVCLPSLFEFYMCGLMFWLRISVMWQRREKCLVKREYSWLKSWVQ